MEKLSARWTEHSCWGENLKFMPTLALSFHLAPAFSLIAYHCLKQMLDIHRHGIV